MNAVIYICHGSRVSAGREQAAAFIRECMKRIEMPIQEYCFLELAEPTIEEAFRRCVNKGATKIAVIPVLLLTAAHAKKDIPKEMNRVSALYPDVEVKYGEPIGVHPKMMLPLIERMIQTKEKVDENSMALLIGRGSSDPDVKRDLNSMARLLNDFIDIGDVKTCFLTAALPSLDDGLQMAGESSYDKVFIIPYLLFPGILMKHITKAMETHPYSKKFYLCQYLGYHPVIEDILVEKVIKLLKDEY
jgi:sirohydrochlorin ferrochelatase